MKNLFSRTMLLCMAIALFSCGGNKEDANATTDNAADNSTTTVQAEEPKVEEPTDDKPTSLYVVASSGLNMRKSTDPKSEVVKKIPYGTLVKRVAGQKDVHKMSAENLQGEMIWVTAGDLHGYMFDGFLSQFSPAKKNEFAEDYIKRLKGMGQITDGGSMFDDSDEGHPMSADSLTLATDNMQEAFLIARTIGGGISPGFKYPAPSKVAEAEFENPKKEDYVWTDNLTVKRNAKGEITEMEHYRRQEGGGSSVLVKKVDGGVFIKFGGMGD